MMRFYHLTDVQVLSMPYSRMNLLYDKIDKLEAEEGIRQVTMYHSGNPKELIQLLEDRRDGTTTPRPDSSPKSRELVYEEVAGDGEFERVRQRQQEADRKRKEEWERKRQERA